MDLISAIAAGIIKQITKKKSIVVGIFTALHTFGRDLKRNVHIHLSVTCGGTDKNGTWHNVHFPAEVVKIMWGHRVVDLFYNEYKKGGLILPARYNNKHDFNRWMQELYKIKWYVFLQIPSDNHKRNIEYLRRYNI